MHFIQAKTILTPHSMNIYRGCSHGCIYCDSRSKCYQFTHAFEDNLCRIIEPGVCPTSRRFEALCACRDAGIPTVVWFSPLLPFINDTQENVDGIIDLCVRAGVHAIIC